MNTIITTIMYFVLFLLPLVLCEIPVERYAEIHKICLGKTGVDASVVAGARDGQFPEDNVNLKHYLLCVMEQENCISDGKISEEQTVAAIPAVVFDLYEKPVRACVQEYSGETILEEAAFKTVRCIYLETTDKFVLP